MTLAELEATIRRTLTDIAVACGRDRADTTTLNAAVDTILAAAEQYATYAGGITAERRAVLAEPPPKPGGAKYDDHRARLGLPPNPHLNPRSKDGH
jgi:hypothetical protein